MILAAALAAAVDGADDYYSLKRITPEVLADFDNETFKKMDNDACAEAFAKDIAAQQEKYGDDKPFADPDLDTSEEIYDIAGNCATTAGEEGKNEACMGYDKKVYSHIPIYTAGDTPAIFVDHPSTGDGEGGMAHYIERIYLKAPAGGVVCWEFQGTDGSVNAITDQDMPLTCDADNYNDYTMYAMCNKHGLWTNKPDQPFGDTCAAGVDFSKLKLGSKGDKDGEKTAESAAAPGAGDKSVAAAGAGEESAAESGAGAGDGKKKDESSAGAGVAAVITAAAAAGIAVAIAV